MNNRIDAIYARQSIDKKDSISIESQIEFCKYELRGGSCREYQDKGYSGKNTDRPQFQMLLEDIKRGLIARVVVYKLDRISRSILDFAKMMVLFQEHNVEFICFFHTSRFSLTSGTLLFRSVGGLLFINITKLQDSFPDCLIAYMQLEPF